jgi:hypothetical protein
MKKIFLALLTCLLTFGQSIADDHIVVVFDTSGSMGEYMRSAKQQRMDVAKTALIAVLTQVPSTTKVGIVTFEGWIYDLKIVDKEAVTAAIMRVRSAGGTPLFQYMKIGADRLLAERESQNNVGSYKLLVVTDGEASDPNLNKDRDDRPGYTQDIVSRGLLVDVIGLEMKKDHTLRTQINGSYMAGNDANSLQKSLQKSVAEVGFDGKDGVSKEAFEITSEFPEVFSRSAIKGLTTYGNHPIGDLPKIDQAGDVVAMAMALPDKTPLILKILPILMVVILVLLFIFRK